MDYILYFILTIGILVFVHEFGHFAAAKLCKMRTDVFALGFGKRILGWNRVIGFSFGDLPDGYDGQGHTDYRICMLPLGGYVKIAGMIDESFDTKFAQEAPKPYEFRSKPTYQKLFVIVAGVLMNLLLTLFIFSSINLIQGKLSIKSTSIGTIEENSVADLAGFMEGDDLNSVNGNKVEFWEDVFNQFYLENPGQDLDVELVRNGEKFSLKIPKTILSEASKEDFFLELALSGPYVGQVVEGDPAYQAGIQTGDVFLSINKTQAQDREETTAIISSNKNVEIPVTMLRGGDTIHTSVVPNLAGRIGVYLTDYPVEYKYYGLFGSMSEGMSDIGRYTILTFSMLKHVISGDIEFNSAFGGPVKIAQFAAKSADVGILSFLNFLALLSLSLAIINIMPFPVLDGGHFVILLIEGIFRRELPIKVKIAIQNAGFVLLLLLMAFIIYNDIISI